MAGEMVADIKPLTNEIILCSNSPQEGRLMARFGITYENKYAIFFFYPKL
jgi:hypothetical protein